MSMRRRGTGESGTPRRGSGEAPLAGIRVLDLTQVVAGPYCTMMLADMGEPLQAGVSPQRLGNENPLRVPAGTCRTADGAWLEFMVLGEHNWPPFCRAMGRTAWIDDLRFRTMALRVRHRTQINKLVAARFKEHRAEYWARRLEAERIPYGVVNDYRQALADPQVAHRGLVRELRHPTSGPIRVVGPPWIMSESGTPMAPPANLGQHTAEVLRGWLGMAAGEIESVISKSDGTADERR